MKIAVMSCIHGNYEALDAVLLDLDQHACEKIFCLKHRLEADHNCTKRETEEIRYSRFLENLIKQYDSKMVISEKVNDKKGVKSK